MRDFLVLVHVLVVVLRLAPVLTAVNGEPLHVCPKMDEMRHIPIQILLDLIRLLYQLVECSCI